MNLQPNLKSWLSTDLFNVTSGYLTQNQAQTDSAILNDSRTTVAQKIELIIAEEEDVDGRTVLRTMLDSERNFLLDYAIQSFFAKKIRSQQETDTFAEILIQILNHIFSYGFIPKQMSQGASDDGGGDNNSVSSVHVDHWWDLMTKYLRHEFQSVAFINQKLDSEQEGASKEEKSVTWLLLLVNEDQLLYYCFQSIFSLGPFIASYDENKSYLFRDRDKLLQLARKIYDNKLMIMTPINDEYKEYMHKKLEERRQQNMKMYEAEPIPEPKQV